MFHLGFEQTVLAYIVGLFCPHQHVLIRFVSIISPELLKSKVLQVFKLTGKITIPSSGYNLLLCHAVYLHQELPVSLLLITIFSLIQSGIFEEMVWILGPSFLPQFPLLSQETVVFSRLLENGAERYYFGVLCSFIIT